jgi:hypothetical protein
MKAEELRIGNWIRYAGQEIELTRQKFKLSVFTLGLDELHEPIRLTEEWFVKFGFKPLNGHEFSFWLDEWECLSLYAEPYPKSFAIGLSRGLKDIWSTGKIQYVHQLQNLYFALTGTELTIK